jgi:hypothetical protein
LAQKSYIDCGGRTLTSQACLLPKHSLYPLALHD